MRILWNNEAISATLTVAGSDPDYPVSNIQDRRLSRYYKTLTDSEQYIEIDELITASYFAIFNHNISSTATIKLQGANEDTNDLVDWDNPDYEITIPYTEYYLIRNFTEVAYDRWRLYIDDPLNVDGYIKIGYLYLGTYLQMPGMKIDQQIPNFTTSRVSIGEGGQAYGDEGYDYRNPNINFPLLTQAQRVEMKSMWNECKNIKPVILLIWANELDFESPIYCVIDQNNIPFKRTESPNLQWSAKIKFREVY